MPLFLHPILESVAFCPHLPRHQKAPRFFWEDECANFWPACPDLRRWMSPHSGVSQVPLALPVGLHPLRHQPLRNCKSDNGLSPGKKLACPPAKPHLRKPCGGQAPRQRQVRRAGQNSDAGLSFPSDQCPKSMVYRLNHSL